LAERRDGGDAAEPAAGAVRIVREQNVARSREKLDAAALDRMTAAIAENFNNQIDAFHTSARLLDDGVIDPRDKAMAICREGDRRRPNAIQFAVARP
jgi:geranyl-CoA carboxylase beta subunit